MLMRGKGPYFLFPPLPSHSLEDAKTGSPPIFFSFWQEWKGERGGRGIEREEEEERLSNFLTRCVGNNFFLSPRL